jgi:hypothetical protein
MIKLLTINRKHILTLHSVVKCKKSPLIAWQSLRGDLAILVKQLVEVSPSCQLDQ